MDAAPESSEGDELDVLVTLVEAWELGACPFNSTFNSNSNS